MATQHATIEREDKGALWIDLHYTDFCRESSGTRLEHGEEMFGVPFEKWEQHIGQNVDLSTWEGTGEGMIGGPTKRQVALYIGGPLEHVTPWTDIEEIQKGIAEILLWLEDEDCEYLPEARKLIAMEIRHARQCMRMIRERKSRK